MISLEKTSKLLIYIPLVLLALMVLVFACIYIFDLYEKPVAKALVEIKAFHSDKKIYGSRKDIKFNLRAETSQATEVMVYIRGIKPQGWFYINLKENASLKKGENTFEFTGVTPSCTSGCGGVSPGIYDISLEIKDSQDVLLASGATKIELISD